LILGAEPGLRIRVNAGEGRAGCAIFGVPSGLFSPEFDASFVSGGAPEVDGEGPVALGKIDGDGENFRIGRREQALDLSAGVGWLALTARRSAAPAARIAPAIPGWVAMASMATIAPFNPSFSAHRSRRAGMAVRWLVLPSSAAWPSKRRRVAAKAETRWSGACPLARACLRRQVLPSRSLSIDRDAFGTVRPSFPHPGWESF
jgi:hypothetical protein